MAVASERLDLRLETQEKEIIERAAKLSGTPVSTFVRTVTLQKARDVVVSAQRAETVMLSPVESRNFLEALNRPFEANAKLARAMARAEALGS